MFAIFFNIFINVVCFKIHWILGVLSLGLWIRPTR